MHQNHCRNAADSAQDEGRRVRCAVVPGFFFTTLLACAAIVGCDAGPRSLISSGESLPELRVAGWLGGEIPSWESLKGKVVVVESWAYW